MYSALVRGATEVLGVVAEVDAVDDGRVGPSSQLRQLDQPLGVPDADQRASGTGRRNHGALLRRKKKIVGPEFDQSMAFFIHHFNLLTVLLMAMQAMTPS